MRTLRVISCNVNGIRAATAKSFWQWLETQNADVICLQEVRATEQQFPEQALNFMDYHRYLQPATKAGYSGVALYTREKPNKVVSVMGHSVLDDEGRYLQADYEDFSVLSVYFPSGSSGETRQAMKYEFLEHFYKKLSKFRNDKRSYIICGDWNIAHKQIDIKNWKANQKNSGFLPEEREWMDQVIEQLGYVDAFRVRNSNAEEYTWWSSRGQARKNNVGWRIDYQIVTPCLKDRVRNVEIYRAQNFSDHAPLIIDYDLG